MPSSKTETELTPKILRLAIFDFLKQKESFHLSADVPFEESGIKYNVGIGNDKNPYISLSFSYINSLIVEVKTYNNNGTNIYEFDVKVNNPPPLISTKRSASDKEREIILSHVANITFVKSVIDTQQAKASSSKQQSTYKKVPNTRMHL